MSTPISMRSLAIWACCLLGGNVVNAAQCNADNCLRALFPTQSLAAYSSDASFCATFTASVDKRTTGFPSRATSACGNAASRYSSACSCKPTISTTMTTSSTSTSSSSTSSSSTSSSTSATPTPCTPSSPFGDAVVNGNFECGLPPWVAADIAGTSHKISSPGDASKSAYEFDQNGSIAPNALQNPASVNQDLNTVAGVPYNLRFRSYFDKCTGSEGFIGVKINGQPVYTVDACDYPAMAFNDNLVQFFAGVSGTNVRFEFLVGETDAVVKIDNVSATPLH